MRAICNVNWPSDMDLGCGFQVSLSAGTLSRMRLVAALSSRNSRIISCSGEIKVAVVIVSPGWVEDVEVCGSETALLPLVSIICFSPAATTSPRAVVSSYADSFPSQQSCAFAGCTYGCL